MSYNEGLLNTYSAPAGVDLSGKQFYGVALVADANNPPGVHLALGVAAKAIAGVVAANGTAEDPRAYGEKVARRFCPNILPYEATAGESRTAGA